MPCTHTRRFWTRASSSSTGFFNTNNFISGNIGFSMNHNLVPGLAINLDMSKAPESYNFGIFVSDGSLDDKFFYTNPSLIKTLQTLPSLHNKQIGGIRYYDIHGLDRKIPPKTTYSPQVFPFEKLEGGTFMKLFQGKGMGLELERICLSELIRHQGDVIIDARFGISSDMIISHARRGTVVYGKEPFCMKASKMLSLIERARREGKKKNMAPVRVRAKPAKTKYRFGKNRRK